MFDALTIVTVIFVYMSLLFLVANRVERKSRSGRNPANNAVVYSLSLAIYCTSWTFYGSVGVAASSSVLFLTIYLGPTLSIILWEGVLRKLIRIKQSYRINSIADFIAARYNRSQPLAAMVTFIAFIGIAPYIALQFKAIVSTFKILTVPAGSGTSWVSDYPGPIIIVFMIIFTIVFGVRRLDPTERHQGMVAAVAVESVVKLVAFLAVGLFVCYFIFDGVSDIFHRWSTSSLNTRNLSNTTTNVSPATWITYLVLGMSAIMFLPRQFHIAVVENSNVNHIRTAKWLFPLYMFLINLFVLPVALAGLMKGLSPDNADMFVLNLPLQYGGAWLTLLVFIGGFSAATSMIMISSMTMATMFTNHFFLPLIDLLPRLGFLRRQILKIRWMAVAGVILLGYWFEIALGGSYTLVNMGIISFAAAFQFAPSIIGGMFWKRGSEGGAILGLGAGFLVWFYTLLLPTFVRSGWISHRLLEAGPLGIGFLNPERLFGLTDLPALPHGVLWTMIFNIGLYAFGSLVFPNRNSAQERADTFVELQTPPSTLVYEAAEASKIPLEEKRNRLFESVRGYLGQQQAEMLVERCLMKANLSENSLITVLELTEFCSIAEKLLAGSIGTTAAYKTLKHAEMFTAQESKELTAVYGKMLAEMEVRPEELKRKIDYYREKEEMMSAHAADLEEKLELLRNSEERYRVLYYYSKDAMMIIDPGKRYLNANPAAIELFGFEREEEFKRRSPADLSPEFQEDGARSSEKAELMSTIAMKKGSHYFQWKHRRANGEEFFATVLLTRMQLRDKPVLQATVRDITHQVKAEKELIQAQKMETVGTLAGGLAHDFNNVLGGILATLSVMSHKLKRWGSIDHEKLLDYISVMTQSSLRAADMIKQLLTLSRKQDLSFAPLDLNLTIKHVIKIAKSTFDKSVKLDPHYQDAPVMVKADPAQIEQVLLNLSVNAEHAMTIMRDKGEAWGGTMTLSTERITADRHFRDSHPEAKESEYWILSVKDTGVGLDKSSVSAIFDPFYTTKEKGKGTGLGLSMAYSIIRQHNGFIEVYSEKGRGTTINVYLPVLKEELEPSGDSSDEAGLSHGEGLVLVVDDEEVMRMASRDILEECGYEVILAENGEEAVELYRERFREISVVLLDMSMPVMSGREAYIRMKEINPDLKVLLISGLKQDYRVTELMDMGVRHFLQKPFTIKKLAAAIEEVLTQK